MASILYPVHSPSPVNEVQMSDYVTDGNTVTDRSTVNNIVVPQSPKVPRRRGKNIIIVIIIIILLLYYDISIEGVCVRIIFF